MRIAVIGHSGSGKSTLARALGERLSLPVLHLDSLHFLPGWVERPREEERRLVGEFLDANDGWVIDGTYSKLHFERRLESADLILLLDFNRFACYFRAWRRFRRYKGRTRLDMAEGCTEKFDLAFQKWILWEGRSRKARDRFRKIRRDYAGKCTVLRTQRDIDTFLARFEPPISCSRSK